jgi:adenosylcobyric acid synthase
MGRTQGGRAWLEISERNGTPVSVQDGAVSGNGRVWGCYLHGLFENQALRRAWLTSLGWREEGRPAWTTVEHEAAFERLADAVETALDMQRLEAITA